MTNIVTHNYQGFAISQRENNGYVSLTDMAKVTGKLVGHYLALESTKEYLQALSADIAIAISDLVKVSKGGNLEQGTWAHPEIAIDFASWCNVQFRIWANRTLLRGAPKSANAEDDLFETAKRELKAAQAELMQVQAQIAKAKASKLKAKLVSSVPTSDLDLLPAVTAYCEGKTRVSTTEILRHLAPSKGNYNNCQHKNVADCLKQLGYAKNGKRHRIFKAQVYTWVPTT